MKTFAKATLCAVAAALLSAPLHAVTLPLFHHDDMADGRSMRDTHINRPMSKAPAKEADANLDPVGTREPMRGLGELRLMRKNLPNGQPVFYYVPAERF